MTRRVVIDAPVSATKAVAGRTSTVSEEIIGETQERIGHAIRVSSVRLDSGGMRIRLTMIRGGLASA